jgi:CubicO group peptidase (beta-lactamase class C family)
MKAKLKILPVFLTIVLLAGLWGLYQFHAGFRRQLTAVIAGSDAVGYQEPRITVRLAPGPPQPKISPEEAGIALVGIQAAVDYAAARHTRALVIGHGGHIVFEKYWDGSTLETAVDLSGFTPALSALLLGAVMNEERSVNLDAPLSGYVSAWAGDPRGAVTLRQLVTRSSGFASADGRPWPGTPAGRFTLTPDPRAMLLGWPLDPAMPAGMSPADVNADILALALSERMNESFDKLLARLVWQPIEGGEFSLARGARAGCCLRARLGDWMRIGEVLANDGVFGGNQLTPPRYVGLMLKPAFKESRSGFFTHVGGAFAARDVAWLEAEGKQRLWIVPSLRLVILRVGDEPEPEDGWDEAIIPDSIIRNTRGWSPAAASEGVDPKRFAPH